MPSPKKAADSLDRVRAVDLACSTLSRVILVLKNSAPRLQENRGLYRVLLKAPFHERFFYSLVSLMNTYDQPVDWMLSWFERTSDVFVGEIKLPVQDERRLRDILMVEPGIPLVGETPIEEVHREAIESLSGLKLDLSRYEYFVGAIEQKRA